MLVKTLTYLEADVNNAIFLYLSDMSSQYCYVVDKSLKVNTLNILFRQYAIGNRLFFIITIEMPGSSDHLFE